MKKTLLLLITILAFGCSSTTPYKRWEGTPVYDINSGEQIGIDNIVEKTMTHKEAKEAGYNFLDRNSDQWWAYPFLLIKGLFQSIDQKYEN